MKEVTIIKNFASQEELKNLDIWVKTLYDEKKLVLWNESNYIGGYRINDPQNTTWDKDEFNRVLKAVDNVPNEFFEIRNRIKKVLNFENELIRKNTASFVGYMMKDGFVPTHKDSSFPGHTHIRANIMVAIEKGGDPIIDKKTYFLKSGDLIAFPADLIEHSTSIQLSEKPRILISYAFLIPLK
jgi:hypothetical protein